MEAQLLPAFLGAGGSPTSDPDLGVWIHHTETPQSVWNLSPLIARLKLA